MRETWARIEGWLARHAPDILADLGGGATAGDIRWAEGQIGCAFPDAFKESHLIHDGSGSCALLDYRDFYSLAEVVSAWRPLKGCVDRGSFAEFDRVCEGESGGPIRRQGGT